MKKILFLLFAVTAVLVLHAQQTPQSDTLQQYTGKYKFPDGSVVTEIAVALENSVLMANSVMGSSELRKTEGDKFEVVAYGGLATFKRNTEGKISGVQIIVGDIILEGTKIEGIMINFYAASFLPIVSLYKGKIRQA